jgi:hypothetical protein
MCGEDQPLNSLGAGYLSLCVAHVCYLVNECPLKGNEISITL